MNIFKSPFLMTILFGMFCGISIIPLKLVLDYWFFRPAAMNLALWFFTAGYTLLLCWYSEQGLTSVTFPVLFLLLTAFVVPSVDAFFCLALAQASWIRSGICYQKHGRRGIRLWVEMILWMLGSAIVAVFNPASIPAWILGIWLYFLLQALYFAIFENELPSLPREVEPQIDSFELASRRAEEILASGG